MVEKKTEVFQVEKKQAVVVSEFEYYVQDSCLGLVELEKAAEKLRTEVRDCRAHRMALLSEDIEEAYRA